MRLTSEGGKNIDTVLDHQISFFDKLRFRPKTGPCDAISSRTPCVSDLADGAVVKVPNVQVQLRGILDLPGERLEDQREKQRPRGSPCWMPVALDSSKSPKNRVEGQE